ncbi:MAG TPA: SelL-related redox protein [Holophagaceae bacterium]|nr:SelL-related redox protein [Holophagaceae bacterium]
MDQPVWKVNALRGLGSLVALAGAAALVRGPSPSARGLGILLLPLGLGLVLAARDPLRHWGLVAQGALVALGAPLSLPHAVREGTLPPAEALGLGMLCWAVGAFCLAILVGAWAQAAQEAEGDRKPLRQALEEAITQHGENLSELSHRSPVLIVFLRHFGCTFCREACHELARRRKALEARGTRLVLVHLGTEEEAATFFESYGLGDVDRVGDRVRWLYRSFGLRRGSLWQLLGPRVWWRGFKAGVLNGHGISRLGGDALQMPGVFLVHHDEMLRSHVHRDASDRPDYAELAICPAQPRNGR